MVMQPKLRGGLFGTGSATYQLGELHRLDRYIQWPR
jgi:hypothetical protein